MNYISRLLALPLLVIVFGAFTIKIAENISNPTSTQKLDRKIVVVIDAGHGGTDFGAVNKNGITEKDVALQLAKKIKALNNDENIEIILTRDNDVYADPRQKAEFAKAKNPDMFISIHLESTSKSEWNTVSGMSVYVTRKPIPNLEKSKVLASAIISSFNKNYELNVAMMPNQREKGIWILDANTFPSILLQPGYLTNDKDLTYLQSEKGQATFAKNVLDAIRQYAAQKIDNEKRVLKKIINDTLYYFNGKQIKKSELEKTPIFNKLYVKTYKPNEAAIKFKTSNNETVIELIGKNEGSFESREIPLTLSDSLKINNEPINLRKNDFSDTAYVIFLLDGIQISNEEGKKNFLAMPNSIQNIQVYDADAAFKTFGIKTKSRVVNYSTKRITEINGKVFTQVEVESEFPGGKDAWRKFLQTNLDGSIAVKERLNAGSYTFITKFIVHDDGSLSDFSSEKNINDTIAKHCIEVIKKSAKWKPAMQNGHIVAAYRRQPITFVVAEEDDKPIKAVSNLDPIFRIGNLTKSRVSVSEFIKQKYATVTDNYELNEATVFFAGNGFPKVETAKLYGNDFSKLKVFLTKCLSGTNIVFTNIKVKNSSGLRVIDDKAYSLY